MEKCVDMGGIA